MRRLGRFAVNSLLLVMFLSLLVLPISSLGMATFVPDSTEVLGTSVTVPARPQVSPTRRARGENASVHNVENYNELETSDAQTTQSTGSEVKLPQLP